jgi:hypothetical protein
MKRALSIVATIGLLLAAATPTMAATRHNHQRTTGYAYTADPAFGNPAGIDYAKQTGRCVADLGYGRFEYCGW